jgi:hypothetical protein
VEARRRKAAEAAKKLAKKQNRQPQPVTANGLKLAKTFWGRAWCDHLHTFHDYANRLPRGATYLRNGSVVDLVIHAGRIEALVAGSETYQVAITIQALDQGQWKKIREHCSRSIESLLDLLSGRLSEGIMRVLTDRETGLFPKPREIRMRCNCPDGAAVCKHLAAVMYGVGGTAVPAAGRRSGGAGFAGRDGRRAGSRIGRTVIGFAGGCRPGGDVWNRARPGGSHGDCAGQERGGHSRTPLADQRPSRRVATAELQDCRTGPATTPA